MRKMDARFLIAWEDTNNTAFNFMGRVKLPLAPEQETKLKSLGIRTIIGPVFTAHQLSRETVQKLMDLEFVEYLSLATQLHPEQN